MKRKLKKLITNKDNNNIQEELIPRETEDIQQQQHMEDFFDKLKNDIDSFDEEAWSNNTGFVTPNFPSFTEGLEGWSPGFYIWAGSANHGKSAIMLNIMEDLCSHAENKLFGIYYSLDDTRNRIIPRVVAMRECIPISVVAKPMRYQNMIDEGHPDASNMAMLLDKRKEGLDNLKKDSDKLVIFESQEVEFIDDIYEKTDQVYHYIKSKDKDANIIVAIDSLKDIMLHDANKMTSNEKIDTIAKRVKDLSKKYNCIVFASMHLRKLNGNRRPSMDDIKDSNTLEYEGDVFFLINNDVSKNKQSAKIYYGGPENGTEKKPVIEVDWGKNKLSSYKGITFCNFEPECSKCIESDPTSVQTYMNIYNGL